MNLSSIFKGRVVEEEIVALTPIAEESLVITISQSLIVYLLFHSQFER